MMKETDIKLLCVLLMDTIYNDIRMIVREELERAGRLQDEVKLEASQ